MFYWDFLESLGYREIIKSIFRIIENLLKVLEDLWEYEKMFRVNDILGNVLDLMRFLVGY